MHLKDQELKQISRHKKVFFQEWVDLAWGAVYAKNYL